MLTELSIRNLGLIEDSSVELTSGLVAISGETGAGKSMLLSAIHLLTGGRASSSAVSKGAVQLSVDSSWDLSTCPTDSVLIKDLDDLGVELDEGVLHLSRTVKSDGKSKAALGGRPTTAKALTVATNHLLSLHGQSDQLKLRDSAEQLRILDTFGLNNDEGFTALSSYKKAYKNWKQAAQKLKEVKANASSKRREINGLKSFIEDYETVNPELGELEELESTINRLKNHEQIRVNLIGAQNALESEENNVVAALEVATDELRRAKTLSSDLTELHGQMESICDQLVEVTRAIDLELDRSDSDALEELAEAQGRILEISGLLKRSGVETIEELETEIEESCSKLKELEVYEKPLDELEAELEASRKNLEKYGSHLSSIRRAKGEVLSKRVNSELADLAMGSTVFSVELLPSEPSLKGLDEVCFTIKQSGQDPQPMGKSASGGELSRLMLALELSVADQQASKTYIFDEVDSGIGGTTALEVGKRLARLGERHQVIVVSHLAQVVAYADLNLKVIKQDDGSTVKTTVEVVDDSERPREIARMLSGIEDSESAREHAKELLINAAELRSKRNKKIGALVGGVK